MNANARTILNIILTLILLAFVISARGQEVSIPDPGLNAAVRDALQIPAGPLTQQALLALTVLDASHRNVKSIAGLETAFNLTVLDLQVNSLTNFSLPSGLTNLDTLDLSSNSLTNCIIPPGLTKLAKLDIGANLLKNFTFPSGLTGLESLSVGNNRLTNLTFPPDLTNLNTLSFLGNPLTSLVLSQPLAASTNLAVNLTDTISSLDNQGFAIFTYPLTVQLVRIRQPIGAFQFGLLGPPGVYTVLASTDLVVWSDLGFASNTVGAIVFTDVTAHLSPRKFYRARLEP